MIQVDPSKTDKQDFLTHAFKHRPKTPMRGAIKLTVNTYFARPKSHYNKKGLKKDAPVYSVKIPDVDNLLKFVGDALNTVFWEDDKLICEAVIVKKYSDTPRVEVSITEVSSET